jgi:CO/xanthine dehydrogenase Mo-binding subunit
VLHHCQAVGGDDAGDEGFAGEDGMAEIFGESFFEPDGEILIAAADDFGAELVKAFVLNGVPEGIGGEIGDAQRRQGMTWISAEKCADGAIGAADGKLVAKDDRARGEPIADLLTRAGKKAVSGEGEAKEGEAKKKFSMHAFGAVFAEVAVDPDYGTVRVRRVSAAYAAGRILNAKTARSQFLGGITFGIGTALLEQTVTDHRTGRVVTHDLEAYMVPVNADVPAIDVAIVPEDDPHTNVIGTKGIGEIGNVGSAAAVANAVFHATGRRVRDFPITPERLL